MIRSRALLLSCLVAALAWALVSAGCLQSEPPPGPVDTTWRRDAGTPVDAGELPPAGPDAGEDAGVEVPGVPDGAVRVASYNVHRFFDTVCDSATCGNGAYEELPTQDEFERKADHVAAAIKLMKPTAVLMQEIETQACLDALSARLSEQLPVAVLGETNFGGSVDVAVMARGELLEVRRHRDLVLTRPDGSTTSFAREFLEVHLKMGDARVIVFAAHFRSKSSDDPGRRLAEAQAAAQIVTASAKEFPDAMIVFGGDLNDVPGSDPINAIEGTGEVLRVASELPVEEQATYIYRGVGDALDHLFLETHAAGHYLPGSVRIVRDEVGTGLGGSDHAGILADFAPPAAAQ